ncbi:MAG: hypothetical protein EZS28_012850 [Streblomastix strix]|uniref:Uncharacterized protein n=1 Tax=Streblomastix strix TaxID=222440 RepID=A0A5J4WAE6_9EUKA|nr:MAG: hypothetical protein EZS28_012850 [Streblomastix strix]
MNNEDAKIQKMNQRKPEIKYMKWKGRKNYRDLFSQKDKERWMIFAERRKICNGNSRYKKKNKNYRELKIMRIQEGKEYKKEISKEKNKYKQKLKEKGLKMKKSDFRQRKKDKKENLKDRRIWL